MNNDWIDNAFDKAKVSDGSEIDAFFENLPKLLTAFEQSMGKDESLHVMRVLVVDKVTAKFVALCYGAGMVDARMKMLDKPAD